MTEGETKRMNVEYENRPDGTVRVTSIDGVVLKYVVIISSPTAHFDRVWWMTDKGNRIDDWRPTAEKCWTCGKIASFKISERRGGAELVWVNFKCGACGAVENEPMD